MILLFLLSISACFLPSLQLNCPSCDKDCGEVGYIDCDACQCSPSCDDLECPAECVLEETSCIESPCPKLPSCIDFSNVCKKGSPLSSLGEPLPVFCDNDIIQCPSPYACKKVGFHSFSVCCVNMDLLDDNRNQPPPLIPNPPLGPDKTEDIPTPKKSLGLCGVANKNIHKKRTDDDKCPDCGLDLCDVTICKDHPDARCISVECACEAYYVDEKGNSVDCHSSENIAPPPFFFPEFDSDPSTLQSSKLPPITTEKETHPPPNNLGSHNTPSGHGDFTVHVIIGCITAVLIIVIVAITCKIYRERRKPRAIPDEEDQRKPLQMSNGEKPQV